MRKVLVAVAVALGTAGLAHADIIELTDSTKVKSPGGQPDDGVTAVNNAIQKNGLDPNAVGPFMGHPTKSCIRGRFILPQAGADGVRDFAQAYGDGKKFFLFEVHSPGNHKWVTSKDALGTDACHWKWVAATKHEIDSLDDVYWLVSDRGKRYPANLVLASLAWAIDKDGKMGLWDGTQIPAIPTTPNEGVVSNFLINTGKLAPQDRQKQRDARIDGLRAQKSNGYCALDPLNMELTPDQVMSMLVEEVARTRADLFPEFGEVRDDSGAVTDALGVRKASRAVAQWICEVLSNAIEDKEQGERVGRIHETPARWVHDFAYGARRTLITYIEHADPTILKKHQQKDAGLLVSAPADPVSLDDLDLADAALDILYHPKGRVAAEPDESGVWSPRKEDVARLVDALVACASASPLLGQGQCDTLVQPVSPQLPASRQLPLDQLHAAVANRALEVLATLPNSHPAGWKPGTGQDDPGALYRQAIESALNKNPPESPKANAARAALVQAGLGTVAEVQATIDRLFSLAVTARPTANGANPGRKQAIDTIKGLAARLASTDLGSPAQKAIDDHLAGLKARQESGAGDGNEKDVLARYLGKND